MPHPAAHVAALAATCGSSRRRGAVTGRHSSRRHRRPTESWPQDASYTASCPSRSACRGRCGKAMTWDRLRSGHTALGELGCQVGAQRLQRILQQPLVVGLARLEPRPFVVEGKIDQELHRVRRKARERTTHARDSTPRCCEPEGHAMASSGRSHAMPSMRARFDGRGQRCPWLKPGVTRLGTPGGAAAARRCAQQARR